MDLTGNCRRHRAVLIDFVDRGNKTEVVITHSQLAAAKKQGTDSGWIDVLECVEKCLK